MIRVDIESIVMAAGPVPSVVVLRERKGGAGSGAPLRALSIQTGAYEAAAIGGGMDSDKAAPRPIAHDVMLRTVQELGAKIERVEINRWEAPVFYADVVLDRGGDADCRGEDGTARAAMSMAIRLRPAAARSRSTRVRATRSPWRRAPTRPFTLRTRS